MNDCIRRPLAVCTVVLLSALQGNGQSLGQTPAQPQTATSQPPLIPGEDIRLNYILGPNDQVLVRVPVAEEVNEKVFRVDDGGNISLPLVGVIRAGNMTVRQLEAELTKRLSAYYRSPQVTVTVVQYRSDPVFFVGAFQKPGIYALQGKKTLLEMISTVGGLQPNASRRLSVTRRADWGKIPLAAAKDDAERKLSAVEISLTQLMETVNPEEDILLQPYDVVRVSMEEMVYLQGSKTGAFPLGERSSLSVLQVISMAGGLPPEAKLDKAVVLRPVMDTARRAEIPVDLKSVMAGRSNDFPLLPNDVLVVPQRSSKGAVFERLLWVVIPSVVSAAIVAGVYRR